MCQIDNLTLVHKFHQTRNLTISGSMFYLGVASRADSPSGDPSKTLGLLDEFTMKHNEVVMQFEGLKFFSIANTRHTKIEPSSQLF